VILFPQVQSKNALSKKNAQCAGKKIHSQ
jgi:hypothetical protein